MSISQEVKEAIAGGIAVISLVAGLIVWYEGILPWWMALIAVFIIWTIIGALIDTPSEESSEWLQEQYRIAEEELRTEGLLDDEYDGEESETGRWSDDQQRRYYEQIDGELIIGHRYEIGYTDFHGNYSERIIVLDNITVNARGDKVLEANCESSGDMRSFKLRNIDMLINLNTGEVLNIVKCKY